MEKFNCRFVAQGLRQIKRMYHQASSSPTLTPPSILKSLASMAMADWEGEQLDVKISYLGADVENELYIELSDGYR